jgi:hypothetical protein
MRASTERRPGVRRDQVGNGAAHPEQEFALLSGMQREPAATIASPSAAFMASGFPHAIHLPASAAVSAISWCMRLGTQMSIRSTSGRAIRRFQSVSTLS